MLLQNSTILKAPTIQGPSILPPSMNNLLPPPIHNSLLAPTTKVDLSKNKSSNSSNDRQNFLAEIRKPKLKLKNVPKPPKIDVAFNNIENLGEKTNITQT